MEDWNLVPRKNDSLCIQNAKSNGHRGCGLTPSLTPPWLVFYSVLFYKKVQVTPVFDVTTNLEGIICIALATKRRFLPCYEKEASNGGCMCR